MQTNVASKICPVPDCGHPMIRQTNKKNPKSPDWKCSNKNCKFQKMMGGGWKKSEFITGVWDDKDTTPERVEDNFQDEANLTYGEQRDEIQDRG